MKCARCHRECAEWLQRRDDFICISCVGAEADVLYDAVRYVLDQAQRDTKGLGYHLGPFMESFERLVTAEAVRLGQARQVIYRRRAS